MPYITDRTRTRLESLAADADWPPGATAERAFAELQDECSDGDATAAAVGAGPMPRRLTHGLRPDGTPAPVRDAALAWVAEARARRERRDREPKTGPGWLSLEHLRRL